MSFTSAITHFYSYSTSKCKPFKREKDSYLLKLNDVCEKLGLSRSCVAKLAAKDPTFPKPIKLGDTRQSPVHYVASEITAWLEAKKAARAA